MVQGKTFDAYEFIAVIAPGTVLTLALTLQWPQLRSLVADGEITFGGFGLFVLIAFVLGHILQSVGNFLEGVVWAFSGKPTAWVRSDKQRLISNAQRAQLERRVAEMEGEPVPKPLANYDRRTWASVTRRMYQRVSKAGRSERIDGFNRTYGLFRGLGAAFLVVLLWLLATAQIALVPTGLVALLTGAATFRMVRFGIHYARCLLLEFVDI